MITIFLEGMWFYGGESGSRCHIPLAVMLALVKISSLLAASTWNQFKRPKEKIHVALVNRVAGYES